MAADSLHTREIQINLETTGDQMIEFVEMHLPDLSEAQSSFDAEEVRSSYRILGGMGVSGASLSYVTAHYKRSGHLEDPSELYGLDFGCDEGDDAAFEVTRNPGLPLFGIAIVYHNPTYFSPNLTGWFGPLQVYVDEQQEKSLAFRFHAAHLIKGVIAASKNDQLVPILPSK